MFDSCFVIDEAFESNCIPFSGICSVMDVSHYTSFGCYLIANNFCLKKRKQQLLNAISVAFLAFSPNAMN